MHQFFNPSVLFVFVVGYYLFANVDGLELTEHGIFDQIEDVAQKTVKRTIDTTEQAEDDLDLNLPTSSSYTRYQQAISDNHLSQEEMESFRRTTPPGSTTSSQPNNQCRFRHYTCQSQELVGRCELFRNGMPGCRAGDWTDILNRDCRNQYVQMLAARRRQLPADED